MQLDSLSNSAYCMPLTIKTGRNMLQPCLQLVTNDLKGQVWFNVAEKQIN